MFTIIYEWNGFTITEKRNGLCYAKMLAERHNGKVLCNGAVVWERRQFSPATSYSYTYIMSPPAGSSFARLALVR